MTTAHHNDSGTEYRTRTTRRTWLVTATLMMAVLLTACGGGNRFDTGTAELTLVSSGAYLRGDPEPRTSFDVSAMKTDPTNFGVVVWWEYETHESDPRVSVDVTASYAIDNFSPDGNSVTTARVVPASPRNESLTVEEFEGGFRVEWQLGLLLGASDLTDPAAFAELLQDSGVDLEDSNYRISFAEDLDQDGILIYDVALSGDITLGGDTRIIRSPVRFEATESDPTVTWVPRDDDALDALERSERIDDSEGSGCAVVGIEVDLPTAVLTTPDGRGTVNVSVPDGWDAEIPDYGGVCPPNLVSFDVPDDNGRLRSGPSVLIVEPYADALLEHIAEEQILDNIRLDDDGEEFSLQPGDDDYRSFEEPEPFDVGGPEAYLVRAVSTFSDGSPSESTSLYVDLGTSHAEIFDFHGPSFTEADFLAFVAGITFAVE